MVESEQEILREKEESNYGERRPCDSSRQATYEDTIGTRRERERDWEMDEEG